MNNELERMWSEVVVAWFQGVTHHLPLRTEEVTKRDSLNVGGTMAPSMNPECPEYAAGVPTSHLLSAVCNTKCIILLVL